MGRLVVFALVAGCYQGPGGQLQCKITCEGGCPSGMTCSNGFCAASGQTCAAAIDASIDAPPPSCATGVALGRFHSCTVHRDGTVWCVGRNGDGQLGDGTLTNRTTPVQATDSTGAIADATAIAAGSHNTCAVRAGGSVWCWGGNGYGQLGNNTRTNSSVAVQVVDGTLAPITGMTALAASLNHSCAIDQAGQVWCWGNDTSGELGDGQTNNVRPTAALVTTETGALTGAIAIGSGHYDTCVLTNTQQVFCWGYDNEYEVGDNQRTANPFATPVTSATALAVGTFHGLAVLADTSVVSWGDAWQQRLGDPSGDHHQTPLPVQGAADGSPLVGALALAAGAVSCVLMLDHTVRCWGDNPHGQVGSVGTPFPAPVLLADGTPLAGVDQIVASFSHVCAHVAATGELLCWGRNTESELDPSGVNHAVPTPLAIACGATP